MTEQPNPTTTDGPIIQQLVIDDLMERWTLGQARYNVPGLQIGNGRDMAVDALEEAQDLLIYMTGVRERDREITRRLIHLAALHSTGAHCDTCGVDSPCHTVVDVTAILHLMGRLNLEPLTVDDDEDSANNTHE